MKKIIKILSVVAVISMLCMLFTGCDMLDDMKANHGILSEDMQEIKLMDKTFVRLDDDVPYYFNDSFYNTCYVTTEDVPVLLSKTYGTLSYYDRLTGILAVTKLDPSEIEIDPYLSSISYPISTDTYMFFCEEDRFEAYSGVSTEDADRVGFDDYNKDYSKDVFSSSASEEILKLISDTDRWDEDIYEDIIENNRDVIYPIYKCDKAITLVGQLDGYELYIMHGDEVYLTNYYTCSAVKLSDSTAKNITDRYFDYSAE